MSGTPKTPPASFDARQLAETVDTIGLLVASLSDRIDAQGKLLEKVHHVATEARAAAFAAEKATDWKSNGDLISKGIADGSRQIDELVEVIATQLDIGNGIFELMRPLLEARGPEERKRRERLERLQRSMPALLVGAVVVGIALTLIGSRAVGWR